MSLYGYRLVSNAKNCTADYIPSLIGITADQASPAGTDTYFESLADEIEFPADHTVKIARTRWVTYDSMLGNVRDPILAVKAGGLGFYIPRSELDAHLREDGSERAMVVLGMLDFTKGL